MNSLSISDQQVEARDDMSLTLQCPLVTPTYMTRHWSTSTSSSHLIYSQGPSGITKGGRGRIDMSLNADTFELTIGNVKWSDYRLICSVVTHSSTSYHYIFLGIYSESS